MDTAVPIRAEVLAQALGVPVFELQGTDTDPSVFTHVLANREYMVLTAGQRDRELRDLLDTIEQELHENLDPELHGFVDWTAWRKRSMQSGGAAWFAMDGNQMDVEYQGTEYSVFLVESY